MNRGRDIKAERARLGVAQSWLAKQLGIDSRTLSFYEREAIPVSPELLNQIQTILDSIEATAA